MTKRAAKAAARVLMSGWIGEGPKVKEFETAIERQFNFKNCVALNNGTSGLKLAYYLAGINPQDKVITTALTCSATNIPLLHALGGRHQSIQFADIDSETLNISPESIKAILKEPGHENVKAIVAMHWGGYPCKMQEITDIADEYGIKVIEDAAQGLGGKVNWIESAGCGGICSYSKSVGQISDFTMFSFQAIKQLTTVDGGMLVIKDDALYKRAKLLRWYGIDREWKGEDLFWKYQVKEAGWKMHMNDVAATIGIENLKSYPALLRLRQKIDRSYRNELQKVPGLILLKNTIHESAYWLFTILVERREDFKRAMADRGVGVSEAHIRNDIMPIFGGQKQDLPNLNSIEDRYVAIPLHNKMSMEDADYVVQAIKKGW